MRSVLGLVASALAGLAAIIASLDGDADIVPFFVALTFGGGVGAWASNAPYVGARRRVAQGVAVAWLVAAAWVGVLLAWYLSAGSRTSPSPEQVYLGVPATAYHLVGLYAGAVLMFLLAFGRAGRLDGPTIDAPTDTARP
jgi:hypothetical protein